MDLDEPADACWLEDLTPNVVHGAQRRSCETVAEAVRFVMETLSERLRSAAYIRAPGGRLDYPEIVALYESPEYKEFQG